MKVCVGVCVSVCVYVNQRVFVWETVCMREFVWYVYRVYISVCVCVYCVCKRVLVYRDSMCESVCETMCACMWAKRERMNPTQQGAKTPWNFRTTVLVSTINIFIFLKKNLERCLYEEKDRFGLSNLFLLTFDMSETFDPFLNKLEKASIRSTVIHKFLIIR